MRARIAPLLLLLTACTTATSPAPATIPADTPAAVEQTCNPGHTILNASLYVQSAAEYRAAAMLTFNAARAALDAALADPSRTGALEETADAPSQPPALIADLDETLLDNTAFEARVIRAGLTYDRKMWKEWTAEGAAGAVPGAAAFLGYAKSRGVTVFYISNRDEDERMGTRSNLERLGFPLDANVETLLLRSDSSDKSPRRAKVAAAYRVLLLAGDDLNDFASMREKNWQERNDLVTRMETWWGTRWFMLPNPMYGSWENAAIGSGGTPCERVDRKVQRLQP